MTNSMRRGAVAIAAGALALLLGGPAHADQGNAVVESKTTSTVLMGGVTYRVGDATVIESKDGARLRLSELPTTAEGASADDAAVYFEASEGEPSPTAFLIKLTGGMPD